MLDVLSNIYNFIICAAALITCTTFIVVIVVGLVRYISIRSEKSKRRAIQEKNHHLQEFDVACIKEGLLKLIETRTLIEISVDLKGYIPEDAKEFFYDQLSRLDEHIDSMRQSLKRFESLASDRYWETEKIFTNERSRF